MGASSMTRAKGAASCLFVLLTSGCGDGDRTNCVIAQENIDQCNAEIVASLPFGALGYRGLPVEVSPDCSGWNACDAKCIAGASCGAMKLILIGGGADPNRPPVPDAGGFNQCLMKCYDRFHQP
jgi:hypothetical protein